MNVPGDLRSFSLAALWRMVDDAFTEHDLAALRAMEMRCRNDPRSGGRALVARIERCLGILDEDRRRFETRRAFEGPAWEGGRRIVAGVDEAGRGPLAGPVVAAAVVLDRDAYMPGLDDSKRLNPAERERIYDRVVRGAVCYAVGVGSVREIGELNIYRATVVAMERAIRGLARVPDFIITDAVPLRGLDTPQWPVVRGDALSNCVAAASIVAKVTRDRVMVELDREYPQYGFRTHKGYATKAHLEALAKYGPSPHHRAGFHWGREQGLLPGIEGEAGGPA